MKKIIYYLLVCTMLLTATACGKDETIENTEVVEDSGNETNDVEEDQSSKDTKTDILLGVYEGASDYIAVPMGTFIDGTQQNFCEIKMPLEYVMSASYSHDGENSIINEDAYGIVVKNLDLSKNEVANQWVVLVSTGGTTMNFTIIPTSVRTMDDAKSMMGDITELNFANRAFYYVDTNEYATADLNMYYEVNSDVLLAISYEGPVAEEIGLDQLAQNIYDLVEVIE